VPTPAPVNLTVRLNPSRRRMAKSIRRLMDIIAKSDAKLYARNPPIAFLPIFPATDTALTAALTLVYNQLTDLLFPE
jgi:hypothetical protein